MALSKKKLHQIAKSAERQGARVRRTTNGYFIYATNGETMGFHLSPSDRHQERQLMRDLARCGLTP